MLENIFRILAYKLRYFYLGTMKKVNQSINQWINGLLQRWGDKNESWLNLGVVGHRKRGMNESLENP